MRDITRRELLIGSIGLIVGGGLGSCQTARMLHEAQSELEPKPIPDAQSFMYPAHVPNPAEWPDMSFEAQRELAYCMAIELRAIDGEEYFTPQPPEVFERLGIVFPQFCDYVQSEYDAMAGSKFTRKLLPCDPTVYEFASIDNPVAWQRPKGDVQFGHAKNCSNGLSIRQSQRIYEVEQPPMWDVGKPEPVAQWPKFLVGGQTLSYFQLLDNDCIAGEFSLNDPFDTYRAMCFLTDKHKELPADRAIIEAFQQQFV